jgi:hypothetical protein
MRRKVSIVLTTVVAALVLGVVGWAPAASAAAPRCTGEGARNPMINGVPVMTSHLIQFPAHHPEQLYYGIPNTPGTEMGWGFWSCSLVKGMSNEGVRTLQREMNFCYWYVIGNQLDPDGQFGTLTKAALVKVQQELHITADGEYGPQTARTMQHILKNQVWPNDWSCTTLTEQGWPGNSG